MTIAHASVYNVDITGAGDHLVVPAVAGKAIRVWRMILTADVPEDGKVKMRIKAGSSFLPGTFLLFRGSGAMLGAESRSWVLTQVGVSLSINLSGACDVTGSILAEYV